MECLISVVIPVYNAEKYIKHTLESILGQNESRVEVIAVNDGSSDRSLEICNEIQDSRLMVLNQENQGAPSARNHGLSQAKGKYILFFDADDIMCDDLFEKVMPILEDTDADCIVGNFYRMSQDSSQIEYKNLDGKKGIYDTYMMSPYPCCKLYKRETIERYHIVFDPVRLSQDLNFYLKFVGVTSNILFLDIPFCYYRYVGNSISHITDDRILDIGKSIDFCADFYQKNQVEDRKMNWVFLTGLKHVNYQMEKIVRIENRQIAEKLYADMIQIWKKMFKKSGVLLQGQFLIKKAVVTMIQCIYRRKIKKYISSLE